MEIFPLAHIEPGTRADPGGSSPSTVAATQLRKALWRASQRVSDVMQQCVPAGMPYTPQQGAFSAGATTPHGPGHAEPSKRSSCPRKTHINQNAANQSHPLPSSHGGDQAGLSSITLEVMEQSRGTSPAPSQGWHASSTKTCFWGKETTRTHTILRAAPHPLDPHSPGRAGPVGAPRKRPGHGGASTLAIHHPYQPRWQPAGPWQAGPHGERQAGGSGAISHATNKNNWPGRRLQSTRLKFMWLRSPCRCWEDGGSPQHWGGMWVG